MLPKSKHPLFNVTIPSTKKTVKMRPLLVKEEKILLMAKESRDDATILNAIKQVVNNCLEAPIDVEDMTLFDLEYLFLKLRASSVSNIAHIMIIDANDKKQYTLPIDLNDVKVQFPEPQKSNKIKFNDLDIVLRYPRVSLYENPEAFTDNAILTLIANCIDKIFDGDTMFDPRKERPDEIMEFIENLSVPVFEQIKEYVTDTPTLTYTIKYKNSLDEDRTHVLKTLDDFFTLR